MFLSIVPSRHLQDMSSIRLQDMSSRRLQDVFSVTMFHLPRLLQDVLQDVFNTSSRRLQDVFARHLQDVLEDIKLLRWRHVEDVLKTSKCLLGLFLFTVSVFSYTGRIFRSRRHFSRWSHLAWFNWKLIANAFEQYTAKKRIMILITHIESK